MSGNGSPILQVRDLAVSYRTRQGDTRAVEGVSFSVSPGQSLGLVGESGSGKTSVALAILRILPDNGLISGGQIRLDGVDLNSLPEHEMRRYRWKRISMVFQGAMSSLNPVYRVGDQVVEAITAHEAIPVAEARTRTAELFELVDLDPALMSRYPHELSGGMKQRTVIAMALACRPDVVIADEPTTALDVIVQHRILRQLRRIQSLFNMAMIYISHDIAVIAEVSAHIGVMYAGRLVELAEASELFKRPKHPYTSALLSSSPSVLGSRKRLSSLPGEPPDMLSPPAGCRFHPRCSYATAVCHESAPEWLDSGDGHWTACWQPLGQGTDARA